jgi:hypothetical protein
MAARAKEARRRLRQQVKARARAQARQYKALRRQFERSVKVAAVKASKAAAAKRWARKSQRAAKRARKAVNKAVARRSDPVFVARQKVAKVRVAKAKNASKKAMTQLTTVFKAYIRGLPKKHAAAEVKANKAFLAAQTARDKLNVRAVGLSELCGCFAQFFGFTPRILHFFDCFSFECHRS